MTREYCCTCQLSSYKQLLDLMQNNCNFSYPLGLLFLANTNYESTLDQNAANNITNPRPLKMSRSKPLFKNVNATGVDYQRLKTTVQSITSLGNFFGFNWSGIGGSGKPIKLCMKRYPLATITG